MASEEQKIKNVLAMDAMLKAIVGAPNARAALDDEYSLAAIKPTIGAWYFSAKCEECRAISPAIADPSNGHNGSPFSGVGALRFKCHHCENEIVARENDIFPYQWS